jgi:hypothetical protein
MHIPNRTHQLQIVRHTRLHIHMRALISLQCSQSPFCCPARSIILLRRSPPCGTHRQLRATSRVQPFSHPRHHLLPHGCVDRAGLKPDGKRVNRHGRIPK